MDSVLIKERSIATKFVIGVVAFLAGAICLAAIRGLFGLESSEPVHAESKRMVEPTSLPYVRATDPAFDDGQNGSGVLLSGEAREQAFVDRRVDWSIPKPGLTPEEVVRMQVESIRDSRDKPEALIVCYSLASPDNRLTTGPFERFADMLWQPPFNSLAIADVWQVGQPRIAEDYAMVLVTTLDDPRQLSPIAFRFILRRQDSGRGQNCWMTETVMVHSFDAPAISGSSVDGGVPTEEGSIDL